MKVNDLQKHIKDEFNSLNSKDRYRQNAYKGLWRCENVIIDKYFKPTSNILDIGCTAGRTAIALCKKSFQVTGVDIADVMIDLAEQIAEENNYNINYQVGDACDLKFPDNSFDYILFANNGWTHIPTRNKRQIALNEIYRVLKPNGIFIFTAHRRVWLEKPFYWAKQWLKIFILKPLGFKMKEIEFGNRIFYREIDGKKINRWQFIHIPSIEEVEEQIKKSGFELIEEKSMKELSPEDAKVGYSQLSKNERSQKSPVFYVCQK